MEYGSGSTKFLNTDPIWIPIRIRNTATHHELAAVIEPAIVSTVTVAPLVGVEAVAVQTALALPVQNREGLKRQRNKIILIFLPQINPTP